MASYSVIDPPKKKASGVMQLRKSKVEAISSRVNQLSDEALKKGQMKYNQDLYMAKKQETASTTNTNTSFYQRDNNANKFSEGYKHAGKDAKPSRNVEALKNSGAYDHSAPLAGTSSKSLMRKFNPKKGIRRSDAKRSVKKAMLRQMR